MYLQLLNAETQVVTWSPSMCLKSHTTQDPKISSAFNLYLTDFTITEDLYINWNLDGGNLENIEAVLHLRVSQQKIFEFYKL